MNDIKSGDIFIFLVDSKYGLIQVIEKSNIAGYHVRVFCDLLNEIEDKSIETIVNGSEFYYLRDFYEYDLIHKSEYKMKYKIPDGIKMPRYMRACERELNGALFWYVRDIHKGKIVKKYNAFNDELINLSPDSTWGIEYIRKRWMENFTLKLWNDELQNKWYLEYLKAYEPDKLSKFNIGKVDKQCIKKKWMEEKRFAADIVSHVDSLFRNFAKQISDNKENVLAVSETIKQLIEDLNKLNNKHCFIETQEREELIEYIYYILDTYECSDIDDNIDRFRQW